MKHKYEVTCEVNMNASNIHKVMIETNLRKKVEMLAEKKLKNEGYFNIRFLSVKEINS